MDSKSSFSTVKTLELSNGETYAYREAGDLSKEPLIFLHGSGGGSRCWEPLIPELEKDFRILALDLRGHGSTSYNKPITSLEDYADDIKLFCDGLGLKKIILQGWSMGGGITLQFAAKYPEYVDNIILFSSIGMKGLPKFKFDSQWQPTTERLTTYEEIKNHPVVTMSIKIKEEKNVELQKAGVKYSFNGSYYPSEETQAIFFEEWMKQVNHADTAHAMNIFNISKEDHEAAKGNNQIENIKCKVLMLHGAIDLVAPKKYIEETYEALKERAKLIVYEDVGHVVFEDKRKEVVEAIREFLNVEKKE
jgi:2-hydroxy-6-oxonona-2,4-dienedioate hydrolase